MNRFENIRTSCLNLPRKREALCKDLAEMRQRIRDHHGSGETADRAIKHGPGGTVDIGFIAQLGVLTLGHSNPQLAETTGAGPHSSLGKAVRELREAIEAAEEA